MIKKINPANCCGCTACASICTHDAITMVPDTLGFLYPRVDETKCVECGLCDKICQFDDNYDSSQNLSQPIAYAVRHKDVNEIMKSRSGAAFVAISDYILEQGGVIYGAGYKDHFRVAHKRATEKKERDEFRGSKYVQSDLTGIFRQVKEDLKNGLTVLFSGTPCQTAGLRSFIGHKFCEKLILIDIVCHGTPSPFIWKDYLVYIEKKFGRKIVEVNFRDKYLFGWKDHKESFLFNDRSKRVFTSYTFLFYEHIMFRQSCGVCHYTNLQRPSDITLADFWGWENSVPNFNDDDKGVSLVLLNTKKGEVFFDSIVSMIDFKIVDVKNCLQPNLQHPSKIHPQREQFEEIYKRYGFASVLKRYGNKGWRYKAKKYKQRIKAVIKNYLRK